MVTACFTGTRNSARRKKSSASSGMSLVSISWSSNLARRSQSVFDAFDIVFGLLLGGFSSGDDSDHIAPPLGVHDHANQHLDPADADPALFTVVLSVIAQGQHRMLEDIRHVIEVDAVFTDVGLVLGFVPFKPHETSCIYLCTYTIHPRMKKHSPDEAEMQGNPTFHGTT